MGALRERALAKVATVNGIDMQAVAKTILFTVPVGKIFYPFAIIVRKPSASLAGGNDYDFGCGAAADTWLQTVDLSTLTTPTTDYIIVTSLAKFECAVAGDEFGVKPITGSTGAATATMDVFGFLADA